jgi:methanogenic corrinoid protein MtbC1
MSTVTENSTLYDSLIARTDSLNPIALQAAGEFEEKSGTIYQSVENQSKQRQRELSVENSIIQEKLWLDKMNLVNAFTLLCPQMLVKLNAWNYQVYSERGLSFNDFLEDNKAWAQATTENISNPETITAVFDWLINSHNDFIELAKHSNISSFPDNFELNSQAGQFLSYLLDADSTKATATAKDYNQNHNSPTAAYLDLVQPAMYKIGVMWQKNEISPAEEHLATSIVSRIIEEVYENAPSKSSNKNHCLVCTIEGEKHFIGSRIFADMLEMDGWDVEYLGADIPNETLCQYIQKRKNIRLLAVSVSMAFNLGKVKQLIELVKTRHSDVKIIIGGLAINIIPFAKNRLNADAIVPTAAEGIKAAGKFKRE